MVNLIEVFLVIGIGYFCFVYIERGDGNLVWDVVLIVSYVLFSEAYCKGIFFDQYEVRLCDLFIVIEFFIVFLFSVVVFLVCCGRVFFIVIGVEYECCIKKKCVKFQQIFYQQKICF